MSKLKNYIEDLKARAEKAYLQQLARLEEDETRMIQEEGEDPNVYQDNEENR